MRKVNFKLICKITSMKNYSNHRFSFIVLIGALLTLFACQPKDEDLRTPSYPVNPLVFIDDFSGGLQYAAFGGSDVTAFDIDNDVTYAGSAAAMRFAVPDLNSPEGTYAGGVFYVEGGRDLSSFTVLSFYAKASKTATLDVVGFGNDLGENKFVVSANNLAINTNWQKYYIPIPDPSKLKGEKGMFYYAEGPENGEGYTFWIDEVKFEDIGLLAHPQASVMGGENVVKLAYAGVEETINDVSYSINMPDGLNQSFNISSAYFDLYSSNTDVVQITNNEIDIVGNGLALIQAFINGTKAEGSLTLNVQGDFIPAPTPTFDQSNVISIFSDAYQNVSVDFFNGYWEPFQTTVSEDFMVNGDNVLNYVNFNFVGTQFANPTIDASNMTHIHFDVFVPGVVNPAVNLKIILRDFGPNGVDGGGDDTDMEMNFTNNELVQGTWNQLDIPISSMANKNAMGLIIYEGANLPNFFVDNIFFYN